MFSIALKYRREPFVDQFGNSFRYRGILNPDPLDGESKDGRYTYDVFFRLDTAGEGTSQRYTKPPKFAWDRLLEPGFSELMLQAPSAKPSENRQAPQDNK